MFRIIKKTFVVLLTNIVNGSNHTECVSLNSQKCEIPPGLINLHPNKYNQELHCNIPHELSNKVCVPNEI